MRNSMKPRHPNNVASGDEIEDVPPPPPPSTGPRPPAPGVTAAELIAAAFHSAYETLAPNHGYKTREASAVEWDDVPANNKALMVATVQRLLDLGVIWPGQLVIRDTRPTDQAGGA